MLPTDEQIRKLHQKYAHSKADFDLIYTHCKVIDAIATQLINVNPSITIDRDLVHVGCMLHDIGAYDVLENGKFVRGVRHGILGEEILQNEGFPEIISRIASHHTGVGLTKKDVQDQNLPMPVADYTAQTDEERLIMYADKFHSKSNPPTEPPYFCTFEWYRDSISRLGSDKAAKFDALAELFSKPDLVALSNQFNYSIKDFEVISAA